MVNFSQFNTTPDIGLNIKNALSFCKQNGVDTLLFDKGVYHINGNSVESRMLSVSNHGRGQRRIAFFLDGFSDFTIDFGGSEIILDDLMIAVVLQNSKNITLKNFSIYNTVNMSAEGFVYDIEQNGFKMKVTDNHPLFVENGKLYAIGYNNEKNFIVSMNQWDKDTHFLVPYLCDISFDKFQFSQLDEFDFKAETSTENMSRLTLREGDGFCLQHRHRVSCGIHIESSSNIKLFDFTIHNTSGMGVIAQNSKDIEIARMKVTPKSDEYHTLNADATHFVHCSGLIHVHDSLFERQLDDAINVHGIYLRITEKREKSVVLKFMHWETMDINIVKKGSVLATCDPLNLIPKKSYRVKDVKKLNLEEIEVFFEDDINDITVGDNMDEISEVCDVVFENNVCRYNRARSVLLASSGKIILRGNYFESSGRTILFESCGNFWFESGGTRDVLITDNTFSNCNYVGAYNKSGAVIMAVDRKAILEGEYFHKKIEISKNRFINCQSTQVYMNNVEHLILKDNEFTDCAEIPPVITYVKQFES